MKIDRVVASCIIFLLFFFPEPGGWATSAYALPTARSVLIVDQATGEILYSRNPRVKRAPASTVKLLTALVVLDELPLDRIISVHHSVVGTPPSRINLRTSERFYVRDLLRAVLIESANDAARALAIAVAGSEYRFAEKMNEKAKLLGAKDSNFLTASGLPREDQYSTAYDLFLIMKAASQNAFLMETLGTRNRVIYSLDGRRVSLKNHNKMFWRDSREIIGKTGWTRNARHCFVGYMKSGSRSVYVSLLASKKKWDDLSHLANRFVGGRSGSGASSVRKAQQSSGGYDVRQIQSALRQAGYFNRKPTGYFGAITRSAVIRFQKANSLQPDGIVGPETWEALRQYL